MTIAPHIIMGSLCYVFHERQVLLLKRANPPHQGLWSPPGGKMEYGESPQECCIREIQEETNLSIANPELRAIHSIVDVAIPIHWQLFIFRATIAEQFTPQHQPDHNEGEMRWFTLDELPSVNRPYTDTLYWSHLMSDHPTIWQGKVIYDTPDKLVSEHIYAPD